LGVYLIEFRLAQCWSLAGSTSITTFFRLVFAMVTSSWDIGSNMVQISLHATVCQALHGWPPKILPSSARGNSGDAGGMMLPILAGIFLTTDRTLPVSTSVIVFLFAAICLVMLKEELRGKSGPGGGGGQSVFGRALNTDRPTSITVYLVSVVHA
ncbi:hypothetical protein BKA70DRAFT_1124156, partial [Coprinopsis sp. MPI-PUGE-AT-0042]